MTIFKVLNAKNTLEKLNQTNSLGAPEVKGLSKNLRKNKNLTLFYEDLVVRSNEATISTRLVPGARWPYIQSTGNSMLTALAADVRSTKAQVARTYSNNVKLKQLERREKCVPKPLM